MQPINPGVLARFWAKVTKTQTCWEWTGAKTVKGYGQIRIAGRVVYAHRVSYELSRGDIPSRMQIDHTCFNRACVRPDHLRIVTNKQNLENRSGAHRNSKSGIRGVHPWCDKWQATVRHNGKAIYAGLFENLADADAAVRAKRVEIFTHNLLDRATNERS